MKDYAYIGTLHYCIYPDEVINEDDDAHAAELYQSSYNQACNKIEQIEKNLCGFQTVNGQKMLNLSNLDAVIEQERGNMTCFLNNLKGLNLPIPHGDDPDPKFFKEINEIFLQGKLFEIETALKQYEDGTQARAVGDVKGNDINSLYNFYATNFYNAVENAIKDMTKFNESDIQTSVINFLRKKRDELYFKGKGKKKYTKNRVMATQLINLLKDESLFSDILNILTYEDANNPDKEISGETNKLKLENAINSQTVKAHLIKSTTVNTSWERIAVQLFRQILGDGGAAQTGSSGFQKADFIIGSATLDYLDAYNKLQKTQTQENSQTEASTRAKNIKDIGNILKSLKLAQGSLAMVSSKMYSQGRQVTFEGGSSPINGNTLSNVMNLLIGQKKSDWRFYLGNKGNNLCGKSDTTYLQQVLSENIFAFIFDDIKLKFNNDGVKYGGSVAHLMDWNGNIVPLYYYLKYIRDYLAQINIDGISSKDFKFIKVEGFNRSYGAGLSFSDTEKTWQKKYKESINGKQFTIKSGVSITSMIKSVLQKELINL